MIMLPTDAGLGLPLPFGGTLVVVAQKRLRREREGNVQQPQIVVYGVQALKYSALGAVNFVLTFAVFTGLLKVLVQNYLVSLAAAWLVGTIFMYISNFVWVFQSDKALRFDERFIRFMASGIVSITLNLLALRALVEGFGFDAFLAQVMLIPFVVAFNFLSAKYISLRQG